MKEKLILRSATKYKSWLIEEEREVLYSSYISRKLQIVSDKTKEIEQWIERLKIGYSPTNAESIIVKSVYKSIGTHMIPDLAQELKNNLNAVLGSVDSIVEPKENSVIVLTLNQAIEEIRVISDAWSEVKYKNNILSLLIKNVTLEDHDKEVELGNFRIRLDLSNPMRGLYVESEELIECPDGYFHPHVNTSGGLCQGDGAEKMSQALRQGRLEDYFRIVESILRTYNEESPYAPLSEWYDPSREDQTCCDGCNEWICNENISLCEGCQTSYCEYCDEDGCMCDSCLAWRCGECLQSCSECERIQCEECSTSCGSCNNDLCKECIIEICSICNTHVCNSCVTECSDCSDITCDSCHIQCNSCDNNFCVDCQNDCQECGKEICKNCASTCKECADEICKCCREECCDCGTNFCPTCSEKHECLLSGVKNAK